MTKSKMIRMSLAAILMACGTSAAQAGTLGIAANYNEFILGNVAYQNSDVQGKIAVGGNLSVSGTSLADKVGTSTTNVVVGGNFTGTNGTVNGTIVSGGNINYTNPTVYGALQAKGSVYLDPNSGGTAPTSVTYGTTFTKPSWMTVQAQQGTVNVPIDFTAEFNNLKNISLAQVKSSDPYALYQYSQAYFNATGSGINAFNVTASTLAAATGGYNISASSTATVIINVSGTSAELLNTGFNLTGGITADHIIWNFYEATSLQFDGSVTGTVLAPKAAVTASYGGFNGTLIAASLGGMGGGATSIEAHSLMNGSGYSTAFTGTLRDSVAGDAAPVPEPATLGLFGMGALVIGLRRRRR